MISFLSSNLATIAAPRFSFNAVGDSHEAYVELGGESKFLARFTAQELKDRPATEIAALLLAQYALRAPALINNVAEDLRRDPK